MASFTTPDNRAAAIAANQAAAIAHRQAREAGLSNDQIDHRVASRRVGPTGTRRLRPRRVTRHSAATALGRAPGDVRSRRRRVVPLGRRRLRPRAVPATAARHGAATRQR